MSLADDRGDRPCVSFHLQSIKPIKLQMHWTSTWRQCRFHYETWAHLSINVYGAHHLSSPPGCMSFFSSSLFWGGWRMGWNQFSQLTCSAFLQVEKMFYLICCQTTLRCFSDLSLFERATPSPDLTHSVFFCKRCGSRSWPGVTPSSWSLAYLLSVIWFLLSFSLLLKPPLSWFFSLPWVFSRLRKILHTLFAKSSVPFLSRMIGNPECVNLFFLVCARARVCVRL